MNKGVEIMTKVVFTTVETVARVYEVDMEELKGYLNTTVSMTKNYLQT